MLKKSLLHLIYKFPKGSIWQTRYLCLPVAIIATTLEMSRSQLPIWERVMWFGVGLLTWTFLEYVFHRWLLHKKPTTDIGRAILERLHIHHHHDPKDKTQVCIPLLLSLPFWISILATLIFFGGNKSGSALVTCGIALMMVIYDLTHFSAHYMDAPNALLRFLKKHHMLHHFSDHTQRFGVTSPVWDFVFGTYKNRAH